jgi:hypothetical protein
MGSPPELASGTIVIHNGLHMIDRTDWESPHFHLSSVTGELLDSHCSSTLLRSLAEAGLVYGIGSRSRVKRFQYLVDQPEAERALRMSVVTKDSRARTPGDLLARMVADRQTVRRLVMSLSCKDGRVRRAVVFEHKGKR